MGQNAEKELTPAERIVLLSDSWASVRVGEQQIGDYLALAEGFQSDRTRAVLEQMAGQVSYISDYLVTDSDRDAYEQWVRRLFSPIAKELGWTAKPGEGDETKELRARIMSVLGHALRSARGFARRIHSD